MLRIFLLLVIVMENAGCSARDAVMETHEDKTLHLVQSVSGTLEISLYRRDAIDLYVLFELLEQRAIGVDRLVAYSGPSIIRYALIPFELEFDPNLIDDSRAYRLEVTVLQNPQQRAAIVMASFQC